MERRRDRVDRYARVMMAAWEKAEGEPVSVSYVATFADMARAVVSQIELEYENPVHMDINHSYEADHDTDEG